MKHNSHIYSRLGDYAEPIDSTPTWKLALQQVAIYTLLVIGIVATGQLVSFTFEYLLTYGLY